MNYVKNTHAFCISFYGPAVTGPRNEKVVFMIELLSPC